MPTIDNLVTIQGIRGFIDNKDIAWLHIADIAKGLGFTQFKNGVEYVRWETVDNYLIEMGFSQLVGKESFIPENVFYRLAMKAKNETAEKFQAIVADEILPQIRKTGSYSIQKNPAELIAAGYQAALQLIEDMKPKAKKFDELIDSSNYQAMEQAAKVLNIGRNTLFKLLRMYHIFTDRNLPGQTYIDRGYFTVKEYPMTISGEQKMYAQSFVSARGINFLHDFLDKHRFDLDK